jgi:hypothetical protein
MHRWAYLLAIVLALSIGYDLFRMPVQVSDSLGEILDAQAAPSVAAAFRDSIVEAEAPGLGPFHVRPLARTQIKAVFDLSGGRYHLAYRGFHVVLLLLTVVLFVRALHVKTPADLTAAAFALTVLVGATTFMATLREAFPINHFLEMLLLALVALNLAQSRPSWQVDVAAASTFVVAALTVESGLLVWVVIASAWLAGMPGISRRGVIATTVLLVGYVFLRLVVVGGAGPPLTARSSGFLLSVLSPDELREQFGANPLPFYAYNVASSVLSVLFGEPRAGVWIAVGQWLRGDLPPWLLVRLVSSLITTALIGATVYRRLRRRTLDESDRLLVVFVAVLAANSVLSYAYTKDDIISMAGGFYALAAYAAVRDLVGVPRQLGVGAVALSLMLAIASLAWVARCENVHYALLEHAFKERNEWAVPPPITNYAGYPHHPVATSAAMDLVRRLRADALGRPTVSPRFRAGWRNRWFQE